MVERLSSRAALGGEDKQYGTDFRSRCSCKTQIALGRNRYALAINATPAPTDNPPAVGYFRTYVLAAPDFKAAARLIQIELDAESLERPDDHFEQLELSLQIPADADEAPDEPRITYRSGRVFFPEPSDDNQAPEREDLGGGGWLRGLCRRVVAAVRTSRR